MEHTASSIAIFPRHAHAERRTAPRRCEILAFRRDAGPRQGHGTKRVIVLDPFAVERRLLVALAEAQGHRAFPSHDADAFLDEVLNEQPHIAFIHGVFAETARRMAALRDVPPIVLIDPYSPAVREKVPTTYGEFPALRFPIGLREVAQAIQKHAR
jgi:hypothetical protein